MPPITLLPNEPPLVIFCLNSNVMATTQSNHFPQVLQLSYVCSSKFPNLSKWHKGELFLPFASSLSRIAGTLHLWLTKSVSLLQTPLDGRTVDGFSPSICLASILLDKIVDNLPLRDSMRSGSRLELQRPNKNNENFFSNHPRRFLKPCWHYWPPNQN